MFDSLRRWAQSTIDRAIGEVISRAIVVIPFLVAAGFGTAALSIRLNRELGPETGALILAAGFAALGLVAALVVYLRSDAATENGEEPAEPLAGDASEASDASSLANVDRELLMAALTSAAPIALPGLMRMAVRNLPLIAAVAAAAFVISRDNPGVNPSALEPGE